MIIQVGNTLTSVSLRAFISGPYVLGDEIESVHVAPAISYAIKNIRLIAHDGTEWPEVDGRFLNPKVDGKVKYKAGDAVYLHGTVPDTKGE